MRTFYNKTNLSVGLSCLALVAGMSSVAHAQAPAADAAPTIGVAEITVTAQRREQKLQDVGVSVTALGSGDLHKLGVTNSSDIAKAVPGVSLESANGGGVNGNLSIRGITQTDFSPNQESPNSIYLDDIYLSSPNEAAFPLYDLAQVEALRGPQGTLFGRASSGGLINFITTKPSKTWNGYAELGYSSHNTMSAEAAVGGPITDSVRFRLAGRVERGDGYVANTLPGGKAAMEKAFNGIRGQIEADLTPKLNARVELSYDASPSHRDGNYVIKPTALNAAGQPYYLPANTPYNGSAGGTYTLSTTPWVGQFNDQNWLKNHRFGASLYLNYDLGFAKVSSITNYTKFGFSYAEDCDGTAISICNYGYNQNLEQISQELRLNGKTDHLDYTAGFFYLNTRQTAPQYFAYPAYSGTDYGFSTSNNVYQRVDSWALFGQGEYKFTDKLKLTAGVRYTHDIKAISSQAYLNELGAAYGGTGISNPPTQIYEFSSAGAYDILGNTASGSLARHSEGLWTGKIQLDYKVAPHSLLYAGVSRGAKAAGYNTNLGAFLETSQTPFRSEYLYAYEAGAKNQFFNNKLRLNLSAFYYDYHHYQGYAFSGFQSIIGNYDGFFAGGEFEAVFAPTRDFDMSLSGTYLKTKLRGVQSSYQPAGVLSNESTTMAPKWTIYGNVTKRFELPIGTLSVNWNGNFIDKRYASIDNNVMTLVPSAFVHNARIALDIKSQGLELAFFVNNISNKYKVTFVNDVTTSGNWDHGLGYGWQARNYGAPRWIGGSIRKTF